MSEQPPQPAQTVRNLPVGLGVSGVFTAVCLGIVFWRLPGDLSFNLWAGLLWIILSGAVAAIAAFLVRDRMSPKLIVAVGVVAWVAAAAMVIVKTTFD